MKLHGKRMGYLKTSGDDKADQERNDDQKREHGKEYALCAHVALPAS